MKLTTFLLSEMLVLAAASAVFALDRTPAVMVSTSTNNYTFLTGQTAQADFDMLDDWGIAVSNYLGVVSNLARQAYILSGTNNGSGALRTYTYANTGTIINVDSALIGSNYFVAGIQAIGMLHVGMAVTGAMFNAGTVITAVDYDKDVRKVTISLVCAANATFQPASFWGSGTYTHIVPTNWTRCKITVTGGGGSGGADANAAVGCGGGGGGGTSIGFWHLTSGDSYTVTVGAGGAAVTNDNSGNTGGTSSFGSLQTATGGEGGLTAGGHGGDAGYGTGGQINLSGSPGQFSTDAGADGGPGGDSYWGGGGNGEHGGDTDLANAITPGSGGGGGDNDALSGRGQFGTVVVEYY